MLRWFSPSHPQTMQAAVFLGYLSGVFAVISGDPISLLVGLMLVGGAFGVANNKRIGWYVLLAGSAVYVLVRILFVAAGVTSGVNPTLLAINATVFPVALLAAVLHPHTRDYMKAWFE